MSENSRSMVGGLLAAFAIGAAVGAGIALLYAPRSGKATREMLTDKGREFRSRAQGAFEDGREILQDRLSDLAIAVDGGKEAMREERAKRQVIG